MYAIVLSFVARRKPMGVVPRGNDSKWGLEKRVIITGTRKGKPGERNGDVSNPRTMQRNKLFYIRSRDKRP